jgi:hypothetical protein
MLGPGWHICSQEEGQKADFDWGSKNNVRAAGHARSEEVQAENPTVVVQVGAVENSERGLTVVAGEVEVEVVAAAEEGASREPAS